MWIKVLAGVGICLIVGACGRVSKPAQPEGSSYPRTYAVTQE